MNKLMLPLLLLVTLAGCADFVQPPAVAPDQVAATQYWVIKGRMGVQHDKDAWSASFVWEQQPDHYTIQIIAPLGQGTTSIEGSDSMAVAKYPDGQVIEYSAPEQVFQETMGVNLPVASLRYWMLGRENTNLPAKIKRNGAGRVESIWQDGWDVSYLRYAEAQSLPNKIFLSQDQVEVRLVIQEWEFDKANG